MVLLLPLLVMACSGEDLPIGRSFKGNTLVIVIEEIQRVKEVIYQGTDLNYYKVTASDKNNELVAIRLALKNDQANRIVFTVDEGDVELRGTEREQEFKTLNVDRLSVRVQDHPSENRFVPFLWNPHVREQPFELEQNFGLEGWLLFDVPKGTKLRELKWDAGETVYIRKR